MHHSTQAAVPAQHPRGKVGREREVLSVVYMVEDARVFVVQDDVEDSVDDNFRWVDRGRRGTVELCIKLKCSVSGRRLCVNSNQADDEDRSCFALSPWR